MTMKDFFLMLTFVCIAVSSYAQSNQRFETEYAKLFQIKKETYNHKDYLSKSINLLDSTSFFADLVNNNSAYIYYLLTNFSTNENDDMLLTITDSAQLQNQYIELLHNDTAFNVIMHQLTQQISDDSNFRPDTISMDDLLNIAVKYFYILKINEEGNYVGKVCGGLNPIQQTESERKPHIEAFCFTTILNHYQDPDYPMYTEFVKGIKALYTLNLGIDVDDRLLRAQGAMFMFMRNNTALKDLLEVEYEAKKEMLPFVLKTNK